MVWEARTQCRCGAYHANWISRRRRTLTIRCAFCDEVTEQHVYDIVGEHVTPDIHMTWPYGEAEIHGE